MNLTPRIPHLAFTRPAALHYQYYYHRSLLAVLCGGHAYLQGHRSTHHQTQQSASFSRDCPHYHPQWFSTWKNSSGCSGGSSGRALTAHVTLVREARLRCIAILVRPILDRQPFLALYLYRRSIFCVSPWQKILFPYTKDTFCGSLDTEPVSCIGIADPTLMYRAQPWREARSDAAK